MIKHTWTLVCSASAGWCASACVSHSKGCAHQSFQSGKTKLMAHGNKRFRSLTFPRTWPRFIKHFKALKKSWTIRMKWIFHDISGPEMIVFRFPEGSTESRESRDPSTKAKPLGFCNGSIPRCLRVWWGAGTSGNDRSYNSYLVCGWATPRKNMKVNWDDYSQYMEK